MVEKSKNNPVGISIHSLDLYQIFSCLINDLSSSTCSYRAVDVVKRKKVLSKHFYKSNFDVGGITKGLNTYEKNVYNCHLKIR